MDFITRLNEDIKKSMLSKDKVRLSALRDIKSKLLIEATSGSGAVGDDKATTICMKLYKQRMETYDLYIKQGRNDLANEELLQADVIQEFLPKMMDEEEVKRIIYEVMEELKASSMKDMGRVMGAMTKKVAGKFDGKQLSELVRKQLQA